MRPVTALPSLALATASLGGLALATAPSGSAAEPYTVSTLHFKVTAGPEGTCDIVGDLYTPTSASSTNRMPAILTTNGFGGSKDDQAGPRPDFRCNSVGRVPHS